MKHKSLDAMASTTQITLDHEHVFEFYGEYLPGGPEIHKCKYCDVCKIVEAKP